LSNKYLEIAWRTKDPTEVSFDFANSSNLLYLELSNLIVKVLSYFIAFLFNLLSYIYNYTYKIMKRQFDYTSIIRYIGNGLGIVGYFVLLNVDPLWGSIIKIMALGLVTPSCIKWKFWDVIAVFSFYAVLDLNNIYKILSN
jgi:hypothetical protein